MRSWPFVPFRSSGPGVPRMRSRFAAAAAAESASSATTAAMMSFAFTVTLRVVAAVEEEAVECARQLFRREPRACVSHAELPGSRCERDGPAGRRAAQRVLDKVRNRLQ